MRADREATLGGSTVSNNGFKEEKMARDHLSAFLGTLFIYGLIVVSVLAQVQKPMTNDDVIQLVKTGFSEETLLKVVQSRGVAFNLSVEGLSALKAGGVSERIIAAMLDRETEKGRHAQDEPKPVSAWSTGVAVAATPISPSHGIPQEIAGLPSEPGIYYQARGKWLRLEEIRSKKMGSHIGFPTRVIGIGKMRYKAEFRGGSAEIQIAEPQPTLYVRLVPAISVLPKLVPSAVITRLDPKKNRREVEVAAITATTQEVGKGNFRVVLQQVASEIVSITPKSNLEPGEYLLNFGYPDSGYDFGISAR